MHFWRIHTSWVPQKNFSLQFCLTNFLFNELQFVCCTKFRWRNWPRTTAAATTSLWMTAWWPKIKDSCLVNLVCFIARGCIQPAHCIHAWITLVHNDVATPSECSFLSWSPNGVTEPACFFAHTRETASEVISNAIQHITDNKYTLTQRKGPITW